MASLQVDGGREVEGSDGQVGEHTRLLQVGAVLCDHHLGMVA